MNANFFGVGSTPVLEGNLLLTMVGGQPESGVVALNAQTGKTAWQSVGKTTWHKTPKLGWPGEPFPKMRSPAWYAPTQNSPAWALSVRKPVSSFHSMTVGTGKYCAII